MCKSCRSPQELSREYLFAKSASIQPRTGLSKFAKKIRISQKLEQKVGISIGAQAPARACPSVDSGSGAGWLLPLLSSPPTFSKNRAPWYATRRPIGKISAKCCSFSAVSAPIFARK